MDSIYARQGDTVELICSRYYGYTQQATEAVLNANPGLADIGPVLPIGQKVWLPSIQPQHTKTTLKLWD